MMTSRARFASRSVRVALALFVVLLAGCSKDSSPTSASGLPSRLGGYTVSPPSGPFVGPTGVLAVSVNVDCGGTYVLSMAAHRDDGQTQLLGVILPCRSGMSEFHADSADMYAAILSFGQGGHQVSLEVLVGTDESSMRAGNILYRSPMLTTWQVQ